MRELLPDLDAWRSAGADVARAVVVRTFGSAPRPEGAVLIVSTDGRLAGSVSGGCVEGAAFEEVEKARKTGTARVIRYGISDEEAWDVGLACGGTIDVLMEPSLRPEVEHAARQLGRAVITALPAGSPPAEFGPAMPGTGAPLEPALLADELGSLSGSSGNADTDSQLGRLAADALLRGRSRTVEVGGRSWFIEAFPRKPRLVIVGAVQVAIALTGIAKMMGYEVIIVDGRPAFANAERFPEADRVILGWPDEVAEEIELGPADAVAVLTHDVKFDEPAIVTALQRGCRYVGAVGSRKTQTDRRERLRKTGVSDEDLARLRGPIGLDLGGREPHETALAIMAEVVAARYGGSGAPMRERFAEQPVGHALD